MKSIPVDPCCHCGTEIINLGFMALVIMSPLMGTHQHAVVCSECSILLGEFLCPELIGDPAYDQVKAALRETIAREKRGEGGN